MPIWAEFKYREFYDVPRMIVLLHGGRTYLLNCPFDEGIDNYSDSYEVYLLPELPAGALDGSWMPLPGMAEQHVGRVKVNAVQFDPTHRQRLDITTIPLIGSKPPAGKSGLST